MGYQEKDATSARRALIAAAATLPLLMAACSSVEHLDRVAVTQFKPNLRDGTFSFKGFADAVYPLDSQEAERARMRMLEKWLELNHQCPAGYTITQRQPVLRGQGLLAGVFDVFYEGRCKAA